MRYIGFLAVIGLLLVAAAGCSDPAPSASPETEAASYAAPDDPVPSSQDANESIPDKPPAPSVLKKIAFRSEALKTNKRLQIYLPPDYDPNLRYPVLYLLHGYYGTEGAWMPEMQLEKTADRLIAEGRIRPLIIVAPQMDNSYGLNSSDTYRLANPEDPVHSRYYGRYEDYLVQDVVSYVDSHYPTIASKEGRYIGGYSMGGFVSLHVAFRHPGMFGKAGGHSPALWTDWSQVPRMKSWLYPTAAARKERDPIELARTSDLDGMSVYLDCGDKDDFKLYEGTSKLYDILQDRGVASEYHLNPGNHSRTYWKSRVEDYLLFYAGTANEKGRT